jgi:hypothetical protein
VPTPPGSSGRHIPTITDRRYASRDLAGVAVIAAAAVIAALPAAAIVWALVLAAHGELGP